MAMVYLVEQYDMKAMKIFLAHKGKESKGRYQIIGSFKKVSTLTIYYYNPTFNFLMQIIEQF